MPCGDQICRQGGVGNEQSYSGAFGGRRARSCPARPRRSLGADDPARGQSLRSTKILDPVWTTAGSAVRNHGYMIYDTLFATDGNLEDEAADGRQVDDLRRPAHLDLHPT